MIVRVKYMLLGIAIGYVGAVVVMEDRIKNNPFAVISGLCKMAKVDCDIDWRK